MEGKFRPIIVLGVDRSGTSLIANLIVRWGAFPGEKKFLDYADERNPKGFWEYEPMEDFLAGLFSGTKVSRWDPSFQQRLWQRAFIPEIRGQAESLIRKMEAGGRPWMWKEPYLSLSLSFWNLFWKNPVYIVALRNPLDSSVSYEKFQLPLMLQGKMRLTCLFLLRWQFFMVSILEHISNLASTLFVSYEQLLRKPQEECARLCRFLDRECSQQSEETRSGHMAEAIDPALWRHRTGLPFVDSPTPTRVQKALYEHLQRRLTTPEESFQRDLYSLGIEGLEYLENFDLLAAILQKTLPMSAVGS